MNRDLQSVYDQFATTYEQNRGLFDMTAVFQKFQSGLDATPGQLLDLGCGAGEPFARSFIDAGWQVTGVDFSHKMLQLAANYVPEMQRLHADICEVTFAPNSFDAITATYSLFHIPVEDHFALFQKLYRWLLPNGQVLFTYATEEYTGSMEFSGYKQFMGQRLFYSHTTPDQLFADLEKVGFNIESAIKRNIGGEIFLWITVKK